jgi:hypothetical protein
MLILVLFQTYQLMYRSWLANFWNSTITSELETALPIITSGKKVLVYQAPEAITFIPGKNYYQFMKITPTVSVGSSSIEKYRKAGVDLIITGLPDKVFPGFKAAGKINYLTVWVRND